jgi:hypothetical protein
MPMTIGCRSSLSLDNRGGFSYTFDRRRAALRAVRGVDDLTLGDPLQGETDSAAEENRPAGTAKETTHGQD